MSLKCAKEEALAAEVLFGMWLPNGIEWTTIQIQAVAKNHDRIWLITNHGADLRVSVCAESLCLVVMLNRRLIAETH